MSWEGGVDLVASTVSEESQPNVIIHVARMVHTPVGSAPSGLILFAPTPNAPPRVIGFVSADAKVGAYFGPHVFAGTPFEAAPVIPAQIDIESNDTEVRSRIVIHNYVFETRLYGLGTLQEVGRPIGALPFNQSGLEAVATHASVKVNGEEITVHVPTVGISGGPGAVWAPCGIYAR
jgi:hypothetical protein